MYVRLRGPWIQGRYGATSPKLARIAVRKAYGPIVAVGGLSLTVRRGEVLGLLGPNGAGKSTTVNLAIALVAPDGGRVAVDGVDPVI